MNIKYVCIASKLVRQDVGHTLFLPIKNDEEKLNVTNIFFINMLYRCHK